MINRMILQNCCTILIVGPTIFAKGALCEIVRQRFGEMSETGCGEEKNALSSNLVITK